MVATQTDMHMQDNVNMQDASTQTTSTRPNPVEVYTITQTEDSFGQQCDGKNTHTEVLLAHTLMCINCCINNPQIMTAILQYHYSADPHHNQHHHQVTTAHLH